MIGRKTRTIFKSFLILATVLVLSGCSTTEVDLIYDASAVTNPPVGVAPKSVKILMVNDGRGTDPFWLGAIRGGFGNPLKTLKTKKPVKEVVEKAFAEGLRSRGLLASSEGKFGMEVIINKLDCSQYVRREAHVRIFVSLVELSSSRTVYARDINVDNVTGGDNIFDAGIVADVEDLRKVANQALKQAVDKVLDDRQFVSALTAATLTPSDAKSPTLADCNLADGLCPRILRPPLSNDS